MISIRIKYWVESALVLFIYLFESTPIFYVLQNLLVYRNLPE